MKMPTFKIRTENTPEPMEFVASEWCHKSNTIKVARDDGSSIRVRDGVDVSVRFFCTLEQASLLNYGTRFAMDEYTGLRLYFWRRSGSGAVVEIGGSFA